MPFSLNTVTWGVGTPTILVLHGLGDGAFVWNHVAPVLATRAAVTAIELRGHGDSPHDPAARYDAETHAGDVLEAMRSLVKEPVTLIGHSLGAAVAIYVASMARDQVLGLVLVDGGPWLNPAALRHIHEQFLTQAWFHQSADSLAAELRRRHPLANRQLVKAVAQCALRPLRSGEYELKCDRRLVDGGRAPDDALLWEKLRSFDGPVLLVRGAASAVLGRASAARIAKDLPNCRLHTVPMAGHTVMLDNPDDVVRAIAGFLSETTRHRRPQEAAVC